MNKSTQPSRTLIIKYENNIVKEIKGKPKKFWRYVKSQLKTRERIPNLNNTDGTFSLLPRDKAEALNRYFSSVFVQENLSYMPDITEVFTEPDGADDTLTF